MARRRARDLTVGVFASLALLILALGIMAVGGESRIFSRRAYYRAIFPKTDGLIVGSPVKMAGVQVGSVTGIHLPTNLEAVGIEVQIGIGPAYAARIRADSTAALRYLQILSGEKYVELTPGTPSAELLPEGSVIPAQEETELLQQGANVAENINEIALSLKEILQPLEKGQGLLGEMIQNPEFGKEGLAHLKGALKNLESLTGRIRRGKGLAGRLLYDEEVAGAADKLSQAASDLAELMKALRERQGALGPLLEEGGAGEKMIEDLQAGAASLRNTAARLDSKEGLFGRLLNDPEYSERAASDLSTILHNLAEITEKINQGEGTLGAMVNDRTLYDGMEDVVAGVHDSKFARWLLRRYRKKGIKAKESGEANGGAAGGD